MKSWLLLVYGLLLGFLLAGVVLLVAQPAQGNTVVLLPAPTPTPTLPLSPTKTPQPIMVQVSGEVQSPGTYVLPKNARLQDLIEQAGGLTVNADEDRVNYAALLRDGDYYYIPAPEEAIPETAANAPTNLHAAQDPAFEYPLDLNTADQEALESLPGIGPTKAADILAYREAHGPFTGVDALVNVPGIGASTVESLREYVFVEP